MKSENWMKQPTHPQKNGTPPFTRWIHFFLNVHPYFGKWSNFTISYFSNGLKPPTVTPPFNTTIPLSLQPSNKLPGIPSQGPLTWWCHVIPNSWYPLDTKESDVWPLFFFTAEVFKNQRYLDFESMLLKKRGCLLSWAVRRWAIGGKCVLCFFSIHFQVGMIWL